ncbi:MAG: MFS transporter [Elusimicrobia bacterium]|nr:MFS transporter [Elusimicrobiota bacterium]
MRFVPVRLILTRLVLAVTLLAASWHPTAAQAMARSVGASHASGTRPVVVRVAVPLTAGADASFNARPLGVAQAVLPGINLAAPGVAPGRVVPGGAGRFPLAGGGVALEGSGIDLGAPEAKPETSLVVLGIEPAVVSGRSQARPSATLLDRTRGLVASLQEEPFEGTGRSSRESEAFQAERLSSVYDGVGLKGRPADPVDSAVAAPQTAPQTGLQTKRSLWARLLPSSKDKKASAKRSLVATGFFKVGMEALGVSMPMIALTLFGSAVWMANMAVTWGISMTAASMLAGGWMDRKPVHKIMAKAMVVQAAAVAGILGLFLAGLGTPWLIMPLYAVAGASMGVVITGRNLLPARVLGNDHARLGKFNAVTHLVYEVSGTIAPLLVGLLISKAGLVFGLLLHPPAYLLAAWMFSRVKLDDAGGAPGQARSPSPGKGLRALWNLAKNAVSDVRAGYGVMVKDRGFRWISLMLLGPMIVHRVFESMLVPFFVKTFLGAPERAAWVVSGSNFGELLGAVLLIRAMTAMADKTPSAPYRWVKPMALGTLATWVLALTGNLWAIIPLVVAMSLTWAANDINLTSYLQSKLPPESAGKAMGFLMAAELAAIMGSSYILGFMFDAAAPFVSLVVVNLSATLMAVFFWRGKKRLKDSTAGGPPAPSASAGQNRYRKR